MRKVGMPFVRYMDRVARGPGCPHECMSFDAFIVALSLLSATAAHAMTGAGAAATEAGRAAVAPPAFIHSADVSGECLSSDSH